LRVPNSGEKLAAHREKRRINEDILPESGGENESSPNHIEEEAAEKCKNQKKKRDYPDKARGIRSNSVVGVGKKDMASREGASDHGKKRSR